MKFKCGKCAEVNIVGFDNIENAGEEFITVKCGTCSTLNKLPRGSITQPVVTKQDTLNPTVVLSKHSLMPETLYEEPVVVPGWIFVHDENTTKQSFDLKPGKSIIGRKSSVYAEIPIETNDEYMSRRHCIIEVRSKPGGEFDFLLSDFKALNGTFINGVTKKRLKAEDIILPAFFTSSSRLVLST